MPMRPAVDFPRLMVALATGRDPLPEQPLVAKAGVRTRSPMAIALGAAETSRTRRAVLSAIGRAVSRRGPLRASSEVFTPVLADPASIIAFLLATGTVLARPADVARLTADTVTTHTVTPDAIERLRHALSK